MLLEKIWKFLWKDDSIWSWLVSLLLAFIIVKFLIYPLLGLILGTSFPIVAVVSSSMEHNANPICEQYGTYSNGERYCSKYSNSSYSICGTIQNESGLYTINKYWETCGSWYDNNNISKSKFSKFPFKNGFNTGDVMILIGKEAKDINIGDIVVFDGNENYPIIHRVVNIIEEDNTFFVQTKGDNNPDISNNERRITQDKLKGKAVVRLPLLGWVKIKFNEFGNFLLRRIK